MPLTTDDIVDVTELLNGFRDGLPQGGRIPYVCLSRDACLTSSFREFLRCLREAIESSNEVSSLVPQEDRLRTCVRRWWQRHRDAS